MHPAFPLAILTLALAQPAHTVTDARTPAQLERAAIAAVDAGDLDAAESLFITQAERNPASFTPWFNLAAVACLRGDLNLAEQRLSRAVAMGFSDIRTLRADPHLAALRDTPFFTELESRWPEVLDARHTSDLAVARTLVPRQPEARTLERWKIELLSAHDPTATDQAHAELDRLCAWAVETLFIDLAGPEAFDEDPWAMVVLPDRAEFARWAVATFGPGVRESFSTIGGAYDHDRRRLVARDLGATLRHELIHVLHWRDMSRLGQHHAAWVQEGLAALVEDYDPAPDGAHGITPVPSWRTNTVKRLHDARRLLPLDELAAMPMDRLTADRPLARYAQSRAVMLFLLDRGLLTDFYRAYTHTFDQDPTGLAALRNTLGVEHQGELEQAFQRWITSLPTVAETGADLPATLGVEIDNGDGTGVRVTGLPPGARQRTGLAVGSFITAINHRPTRDLNELIRVLSDYAPGDTVTLSHRRGRLHHTTEVTLQPRE